MNENFKIYLNYDDQCQTWLGHVEDGEMIAFGKTADHAFFRIGGVLHTELEKVGYNRELLPKRVTPLPESYSEIRMIRVEDEIIEFEKLNKP